MTAVVGNPSRTVPNRIAAKQRAADALALRRAGATFSQIAETLHYHSKADAYRAVVRELRQVGREDAAQILDLELQRLDDLQRALWPKAATRGDVKAVDSILRIMQHRARLLGLDVAENRAALAQERSAAADEVTAASLFALVQHVLADLHLTPDQQDAVPGVLLRHLDALEATTDDEEPTDADPR